MADFEYELPNELIAQQPVEPRDAARLLVDRGSDPPDDRVVADLDQLLLPGDLLVVNDSRVVPARLRLHRTSGGAVEVLVLEPLDAQRRTWEALVRPARKLRPGEELHGPDGSAVARIVERTELGDTFVVELVGVGPGVGALEILDQVGEMPLPPYLTERLSDRNRYQTVYANEPGSAAAPTAGLHLTDAVLDRLATRGVELARVELLVGLDTFRPVAVDDPDEHRMHSERYRVPAETLDACASARAGGGRVVAVGTTAVRALESAALTGDRSGRTDLFIRRGFPWQTVDLLMTNFHLPRTTLLLMIDAFVGDRWRNLYDEAIRRRYRFLSFGDAMLLDRGAS